MTTFLWTVVILMAAALLAELCAFIGMALVAMRTARRGAKMAEEVKQTLEPPVRIARELQQSLQPHLQTIQRDTQQIKTLLTARTESVQAAFDDTSRRAERIRLRWMEGVGTVEGQPGRRGIYHEVVVPMQAAGQVMRGLKIALWLLRRVA